MNNDTAKKIEALEEEIKENEEDIFLYEAEKNLQMAGIIKEDIKRLRLRIRRLNSEELRGLSRDEIGYDGDRDACSNCAELLNPRLTHHYCRLLADDDNYVNPGSHCDFWKEAFPG